MSGDPEGYRRACERALDRFSKTSDPAIAERTTKICLLLPNAGVDLNAVSQMAEVATTKATDRGLLGWIELAKCLLQYRQGLFVEAAASARKALGYHGEDYRDAAACLVLAMARYQSKQSDEAQAALTRAVGIIETKLAKPGSREGVVGSPDWIMAHLLFNEAKGLMENPASAGP
jgi:hypothetical protein